MDTNKINVALEVKHRI